MDMTLLIIGVVVALVIILGFIAVPYFKRSGLVKEEDVKFTVELLQIVGIILNEMKLKQEVKDEAVIVVEVARVAVGYVQDMMGDKTIAEQQESAINASIMVLNKMKIEVTDARKELVEITVKLVIK